MGDFALDYDEQRWIVLPAPDEEDAPPGDRAWARRTAYARWFEADGGTEIVSAEDLAEVLAQLADRLWQRDDAEAVLTALILLHHPVGHQMPLPVHIHVRSCLAMAREDVLRGLVRADDPDAVEPPIVEPITARHLGDGLRGLAHFALEDDGGERGLYAVLSYAWQVTERDADVRVWCSTPDLGALTHAVEDIDELVDGIRLSPRREPNPASQPTEVPVATAIRGR